MSIVETFPEPMDTNAKTRVRVAKARVHAGRAQERPRRAETPSLAELQQQRDRAIEEEAKVVLRTSAYHPIRRVSCEVRDCVLVLRGRVPSFYMKQIAQEIVRHLLDGRLVLDNQLEVDHT